MLRGVVVEDHVEVVVVKLRSRNRSQPWRRNLLPDGEATAGSTDSRKSRVPVVVGIVRLGCSIPEASDGGESVMRQ